MDSHEISIKKADHSHFEISYEFMVTVSQVDEINAEIKISGDLVKTDHQIQMRSCHILIDETSLNWLYLTPVIVTNSHLYTLELLTIYWYAFSVEIQVLGNYLIYQCR